MFKKFFIGCSIGLIVACLRNEHTELKPDFLSCLFLFVALAVLAIIEAIEKK